MATLEQFLRTGELGPIHPGMSESEVKDALGSPTVWSNGREPLLSYGAVQLAFEQSGTGSELKDIGLLFSPSREAKPLPGVFPLEDFEQLSPQTTLDEVQEFLVGIGLWGDVKAYYGEQDLVDLIIPPPGARITFHGRKLWSIHFTERTPPKRQISLSLTEGTLQQVKNLARLSNKSVSALCAEWITQRANQLQRAHEEVSSG